MRVEFELFDDRSDLSEGVDVVISPKDAVFGGIGGGGKSLRLSTESIRSSCGFGATCFGVNIGGGGVSS